MALVERERYGILVVVCDYISAAVGRDGDVVRSFVKSNKVFARRRICQAARKYPAIVGNGVGKCNVTVAEGGQRGFQWVVPARRVVNVPTGAVLCCSFNGTIRVDKVD